MKQRLLLFIFIFFGLVLAFSAKADTSTRGCETNTMKSGVFCNWSELKSWCNSNTTVCEVESTTACPSNPVGGTYSFSCNTNNCTLSCNTGYTKCTASTCKLNISVPANCTSFNQCTEVCSACSQGYELISGACVGATLKLSSNSVGVSNYIFQSSTPSLSILASGNVGIGTTNPGATLALLGGEGTYNAPNFGSTNMGAINIRAVTSDRQNGITFSSSASSNAQAGIYVHQDNGLGTHMYFATTDSYAIGPQARLTIKNNGLVGIGITNPGYLLDANGLGNFDNFVYGYTPVSTDDYALTTVEYVNNVLSGTTGSGYLPLIGGTMAGDIAMGGNNISGVGDLSVDKITATTIDPLYTINNVNYATFVASIVGGVKEEYVDKIKIRKLISSSEGKEYEAVIDFSTVEEGSELWVWRQVIDFSKDKVEVFITPYGKFAATYYFIDGERLVFRSDRPAEVSYRLIGKRFDWRNWPMKALDQSGKGMEVK